jgi:hypothetical protein
MLRAWNSGFLLLQSRSPSHSGNKFNPSRDEDNKECIVPMLSVSDISIDTKSQASFHDPAVATGTRTTHGTSSIS